MSSKPHYGHILGDGHGVRRTLTVSEYFNEKGGHFVNDAGSGLVTLVDATTDIPLGWAATGKLVGYGSNWFLAVATSEALIINGADDVYRIPAMSTVSISDIGKKYNIAYSGTNKTTSNFIQKIRNTGTTVATGVLFEVVDVDQDDIDNQTLQVRMTFNIA